MMTIAGVVFSMTLVALSLASSQLGPRLLRNFMRDRVNQWVLGTFIATFFYCLLVLRTIRHTEGDEFVPQLSVSIGVVFALASLWVFIYFIHHVSVMIQSSEVVGRVGRELNACIDRFGNAPRSPQPLRPCPPGFRRTRKGLARAVTAICRSLTATACCAWPARTIWCLKCTPPPATT